MGTKTNSWRDNFGMVIPLDIARHSDGTPITGFSNMAEKEWCRIWIKSIHPEYDELQGKQKEEILKIARENCPEKWKIIVNNWKVRYF